MTSTSLTASHDSGIILAMQNLVQRRRWYARNRKRICKNARAWRKAHPEGNLARDREKAADFKRLLAGLKSAPCKDCGGSFPPCAMDFDHVRGKKARHVGGMGNASFSALVAEIAKCDLVCSNCHRIRTQGRYDVEAQTVDSHA